MRRHRLVAMLPFVMIAGSCDNAAQVSSRVEPITKTPAPGTKPVATPTPAEGELNVVFQTVPATLKTRPTGTESCAPFQVVLRRGESPVADQDVRLRVESAEGGPVLTSFRDATLSSSETGLVAAEICAGASDENVSVTVEWGEQTWKSSSITVAQKVAYSLEFAGIAEREVVLTDGIAMTLEDAGDDCVVLKFRARQGDTPVVGQEAEFVSGVDYPLGFKLAAKGSEGQRRQDTATNKYQAYYKIKSDAQGYFQIPACSGSTPGNTSITGTFTDDDGVKRTAVSPALKIAGGLASWDSLSITFDPTNARTLAAYFDTNSTILHPFQIKVGARGQAELVKTYPAGLLYELGKLELANGGTLSEGSMAPFTMQFLNAGAARPYAVNTGYDVRCDPNHFATAVSYRELNKNWRSTVTYYIKGQEQFFDFNHNGKYDVGGDGFWDKNQNGKFDQGIDELTFDAGNDGLFDENKEWFVDLPTPFVDRNENLIHDAGEPIVGDTFSLPNNVWDAQTTIWKSFVVPMYFGFTVFSLTHSKISAAGDTSETSELQAYRESLDSGSTATQYKNDIVTAGGNTASLFHHYVLAQDKCGSPLPGGSQITVSSAQWNSTDSIVGARAPEVGLFMQPGDDRREAPEQLLSSSTGGYSNTASGTINFNIVDHPAAVAGYPVFFSIAVPLCTSNRPENGTGYYCDSQYWKITLTVSDPLIGTNVSLDKRVTIGAHNSVACNPGYQKNSAIPPACEAIPAPTPTP